MRAIQSAAPVIGPNIGQLVERSYERLLEYDATAPHFVPRQHGYEGEVPGDLSQIDLDHPQIRFRRDHLNRYLLALIGRPYDAKMVLYLDTVGKMHTPKAGNAEIVVPLVQMNALLGLIAAPCSSSCCAPHSSRPREWRSSEPSTSCCGSRTTWSLVTTAAVPTNVPRRGPKLRRGAMGPDVRQSRQTRTQSGGCRAGRYSYYGPQVEIEASGPNGSESGNIYGQALGTDFLKLKVRRVRAIKDAEWNTVRIVAEGPRIRTWINGQAIADVTNEEVYKEHSSGMIGLQVHGVKNLTEPQEIAWRKLRIREVAR